MLDLDEFINKYVIKRSRSIFESDIESNYADLVMAIEGKSILVIGGAGSIGSNFIKTILPFKPKELCVVDTNENALTELTRDLRSSNIYVPSAYLSYPMDYDSVTFRRFFIAHHGFDIVSNFSAHKHVRSEKDIYSVEALLRNNLINVKNLLELLCEYPPEAYFCVSTDKAANPVNIMGASKRLMEDLIFSYSDFFSVKTARFANVAFSNGSLPAGFLRRIQKLQPLSAPFDVRRYFVSPKESGQICMLTTMLGDSCEIFFPRFEEEQMMTFDKIAENLLEVCGYKIRYCKDEADAIARSAELQSGGKVYPVYFSESDTSGEKAYEEFYTKDEIIDYHRFTSLGVITGKDNSNQNSISEFINVLDRALESKNITKSNIVHIISDYLPAFSHIETEKSLDGKL